MEFPDLGKHCSEKTCKQLDFLPMKCDACEEIFCKDHISYAQHSCTSSYKKDIQVPVCPLCNMPVPVKRGEMPDVKVGEHLDRDCKSDPARRKGKIFTNKCMRHGCKQKEMIKVVCEQCHQNFCLKHRHPLDHDCKVDGRPLSKAGHAALMRMQTSSKGSVSSIKAPATSTSSKTVTVNQSTVPSNPQHNRGQAVMSHSSSGIPPVNALQGNLSEEEALQRALQLSLAQSTNALQPSGSQEDEDVALAQALAASEQEEIQRQQQRQVCCSVK
ncbi:AN1-type zinc finger protein 2A isoform X2 [Protopterus annectens]|uniref:AN1-type zinc finger protein 2A isoform X2 n=1 Tax=Protopterus annectens TaxID=7888 RepID=UPI001CFBE8E8|nr:AN1-type zinc finger protein 2A isoform X2 [Protopterus annectens]